MSFSFFVMPVQTSVGPIFASIWSCGHSTTVAKGNMYSFLAIAASGARAVDDHRPQVVAALLLDEARAEFARHVGDAGLLQVGFDHVPDALGLAGDGERREAGGRVGRRLDLDRAELLGEGLGDFLRVPRGPDARSS